VQLSIFKLVIKGGDFILSTNGCFYKENEAMWWVL